MNIFRLLSRNISCALLAAAACAAPAANAATISVASSASQVALGQTFRVDFRIAGLSAAQYDSLSGFDLDVLFDTSVLEFAGFSFLDTPASNQLDLPEPGSFGFFGDASAAGGKVDAYGVSGNSSAILDAAQAGAFRFLSLDFKALAAHAGTAIQIDLADPNLLFLDSGVGLLDTTYGNARVLVAIGQGTPVPEPGTLVLLGLGALGLAAAIRRRKAGGAVLAAAILAAGPAAAQSSTAAPKGLQAAESSNSASVNGEVVEVRGKRVLLRLASGETRWVSSTQELSPSDAGKKLSAKLAQRGDAVVMSDITFTN